MTVAASTPTTADCVLASLPPTTRGPLVRKWAVADALLAEAAKWPASSRERLILQDAHRVLCDVREV